MARRTQNKYIEVTINSDKVQGDGSYVKLKIDRESIVEEQRREAEEKGITFNARGEPMGGEFEIEELERFLLRPIAASLAEWDWVDWEENPLPQLNGDVDLNLDILQEYLTEAEKTFLLDQYEEVVSGPGKGRKSRPTSRR